MKELKEALEGTRYKQKALGKKGWGVLQTSPEESSTNSSCGQALRSANAALAVL